MVVGKKSITDRFLAHPIVAFWLAIGWVGFFLLPWYILEDGFFQFDWISLEYFWDSDYAPAFFSAFFGGKSWLGLSLIFLVLPLFAFSRKKTDPAYANILIISGLGGLGWIVLQGLGIGLRGWNFEFLQSWLGETEIRQFGMGYGALLTSLSFLFILTTGIARRGAINGDIFVVGMIGFIIAFLLVFVAFPVGNLLTSAFITEEQTYSLAIFWEKLISKRIWSLDCLAGEGLKCGVAWNSLFMAVTVATITTALGLVLALVITRTGVRFKNSLRALSVIPLITPPFVIGLSIILLFGLSGTVTVQISEWFDLEPTRWIYGLPGIVLSQTLGYTPITFLVLIGVLENIGPDLEEASLMLRASRWKTFQSVTLPLLQPGLASAFLLAFIQSLADFGNPFVLGGNYEVLSTEIFYAIVGAQYDQGAASVLSILLLVFTMVAFYLQQFWLSKKSYITITGKSSSSRHPDLPHFFSSTLVTVAFLWFGFTMVIYAMIIYGSFVESWGLNNTLTLKHYLTSFAVSFEERGVQWTGSAWNSFWTTIMVASMSAPLTAFIGIITSWLLSRKTFTGKRVFEFGTMLCFIIPGTVIGVSYILTFNLPPIEITGTGIILVLSFVCRNMPVGIRAGTASLSQIDKSLDESSLTLGANSFNTFLRVNLPLIRPAVLTALVFSFIRSMTAISAVIFLVSSEYDLSTTYIIGRVENNDYGLAIAYSSAMIVVMLTVVVILQRTVGKSPQIKAK